MVKNIWIYIGFYILIFLFFGFLSGFRDLPTLFLPVTILFLIIVVPIKLLLMPMWKETMSSPSSSPIHLGRIMLNKSDFAGINFGTIIAGIASVIFLIASFWFAFPLVNGEIKHDWITFFLLLIVFFLFIGLLIFISMKLSFYKIRKVVEKNNERIVAHVFAQLEANKFDSNSITFSNLNLYYADVILAYTDKKNIYLTPVVYYTKQPVIKISQDSIEAIEVSDLKIQRDRMGEITNAVNFANTAIPLNQVNMILDSKLPLDRFNFKIITKNKKYEISINKKAIKFVKVLLGLN